MIRHIVFDMGRVIINFSPEDFMDREGLTDPGDRILVLNELFRSVEWAQMDLGLLDEEAAEPLVMRRIPDRLKDQVHRLLFAWSRPDDTIPGMESLVRNLKSSGYGIWLLSNASRAQHRYWPKIPVSRFFDGKLVSCDLGIVKPNPEIYMTFVRKFSLLPEECVFIDDSPANIAAAVGCGWSGIVFHGSSTELEAKLHALGVRV